MLTWRSYSDHSARLLRKTYSKTCSPKVSRTKSLAAIAVMASFKSRGSGVNPAASAISGSFKSICGASSSWYPASIPFNPAARITAKARYGLHAESGERNSIRVEFGLFGFYIGIRTSELRLCGPQEINAGASPPPCKRLYELTH